MHIYKYKGIYNAFRMHSIFLFKVIAYRIDAQTYKLKLYKSHVPGRAIFRHFPISFSVPHFSLNHEFYSLSITMFLFNFSRFYPTDWKSN